MNLLRRLVSAAAAMAVIFWYLLHESLVPKDLRTWFYRLRLKERGLKLTDKSEVKDFVDDVNIFIKAITKDSKPRWLTRYYIKEIKGDQRLLRS